MFPYFFFFFSFHLLSWYFLLWWIWHLLLNCLLIYIEMFWDSTVLPSMKTCGFLYEFDSFCLYTLRCCNIHCLNYDMYSNTDEKMRAEITTFASKSLPQQGQKNSFNSTHSLMKLSISKMKITSTNTQFV